MKGLFLLCLTVLLGAQLIAEPSTFSEQVYYTQDQALSYVYPKATTFDKQDLHLSDDQMSRIQDTLGWDVQENHFTYFNVFKDDDFLGYAMIINEKGKYRPITFLAAISPEFMVKDVVVMVYREKIGSAVRKKRFLKQFKNKSLADAIQVDNDIMGISGATISSWSLAAGVKKALVILEDVFQQSSASL